MAVLRELEEEIGTARAAHHRRASGVADATTSRRNCSASPSAAATAASANAGSRCASTGSDADIRLDLDPHPEFDAWRWAELAELPGMAVGFKQAIYDELARSFARFAVPG